MKDKIGEAVDSLLRNLLESKEFNHLVTHLRFKDVDDFKQYMIKHAKLNEWGSICYTEKRKGVYLNYSDNTKHKWGLGMVIKGVFKEYRFN